MFCVGAVCSPITAFAEETVGEKFRRIVAEIDARCRAEKLGPYLDPSDPEYRKKVAVTSCDLLKLEPRDWRAEKMVRTEGQLYPIPERWLATPEGRFAHSIKLPPPHDVLKDTKFADPSSYFDQLCASEAGEFVFEVRHNVAGVLLVRPIQKLPRGYSDLLFHVVERGGMFTSEPQQYFIDASIGRYLFFEVRSRTGESLVDRYVSTRKDVPEKLRDLRGTHVESRAGTRRPSIADVAITWRAIRRPNDWEHAIYGHELIVFEVATGHVLGLRRDFIRFHPVDQLSNKKAVMSRQCSVVGRPRVQPHEFVYLVLNPL